MIKICHLRGRKNYWLSPAGALKKWQRKFYMLPIWEKEYQVNFLDYRRQIRNIIIQSVVDTKEYDIICYNNEELQDVLKQIKDDDVISFHSQDDDDIHLGCTVHNDTLPSGIYNTPNLTINWRNTTLNRATDKPTRFTVRQLLSGVRGGKQHITGSCNLIMVGEFFNFKELLNFISCNSFESRSRFNSFIFNEKKHQHRRVRRVHTHDHKLNVNYLSDPINIEFKHFFSFSYLDRLHKRVELINLGLKTIFTKEYNIIKNCNIENVSYWDQFKSIYEDLYKKLH